MIEKGLIFGVFTAIAVLLSIPMPRHKPPVPMELPPVEYVIPPPPPPPSPPPSVEPVSEEGEMPLNEAQRIPTAPLLDEIEARVNRIQLKAQALEAKTDAKGKN